MVSISKLTADVDVSEYYDKYVDIEKFLEICKECDQYGNNWGCPPFDFDPNEIEEGDYKITFSTEGREYKIHTTKEFKEGARVSIAFGPEDIHVMSKMVNM